MTGAEYDGAVKALQERAEKLVADTRAALAKDATAIIEALEAKADLAERYQSLRHLDRDAVFFRAVPVSLDARQIPYAVLTAGNGNYPINLDPRASAMEADDVKAGEYYLVTCLVPKVKP